MQKDVVIIGAGPAGIFTALEMLKKGGKKDILIVEKGRAVEDRRCPKSKTGQCVNCKPYCHITTGFSGAGAFSDGKLSLSYEVGGDLPTLIGADRAQETIDYTDKIYLEFGADAHVEGLGNTEEVKAIRKRAIRAGLKLVDCPIRHLGTEKAQELYYAIEQYLLKNGVELLFGFECTDLMLEGDVCRGVRITNGREEREIASRHTVIATGRRGADWLESLCAEHNIAHQPGTVDIGVRVEVRNEVMETVNRVLYESKLVGYPRPFKNKVRTFCQNPGGFVSQENYDNDLAGQRPQLQGAEKRQHQSGHPVQPQFFFPLQPAHRLRPEGGRADQHAGGGAHHGPALRRHPGRQADVAEGAGLLQRAAHPAGCGGGRHHGGHALPGHDQYYQFHSGYG